MPQAYFIPLPAASEMPSASQLLAELHSAAFGVLHYGPSHNLLCPACSGTCILRAPSPYPCPGVDRSASGCCPPGLSNAAAMAITSALRLSAVYRMVRIHLTGALSP